MSRSYRPTPEPATDRLATLRERVTRARETWLEAASLGACDRVMRWRRSELRELERALEAAEREARG